MTDKQKNKIALEKMMLKYVDNKDKIDSLTSQNKEMSKLILEAMNELGEEKHLLELTPIDVEKEGYESRRISCSFNKVTKTFVTYNVPLIKKILDKKRFNEIIDRDIFINYDKYVELAKKYKIPKEEALSCLTTVDNINTNKLQYMYETGKINLEELKGTYTLDKQTYLTTRKVK